MSHTNYLLELIAGSLIGILSILFYVTINRRPRKRSIRDIISDMDEKQFNHSIHIEEIKENVQKILKKLKERNKHE